MRIGIDARFFGEAGPGRYVAQLLKNLEKTDPENNYVVYLKRENFETYSPQSPNFKKEIADFSWYSLSEQILFPLKLYRGDFDLVHFTQINVPLLYLRPFVVTIHDLILHEYSTERGYLPRRLLYRLKKLPYILVFAKAVYLAQKILVPSQATKDDLLRYYRVDPQKVVVTPEAVDHYPSAPNVYLPLDVLEKYKIKKPYVLYVGSFYPHKNVARLAKAFKILKDRNLFGGQLVLVGRKSYFSDQLEELLRRENIPDVVFPRGVTPTKADYLSDAEVEPILANAFIYVQPSLKEGFGIPPVEAMVFGVPTTVSDIPCLREMCANASVYFDPKDVDDMVEKIRLVIESESLRRTLVAKGFENVRRFSWSKMAEETLSVYKVTTNSS